VIRQLLPPGEMVE